MPYTQNNLPYSEPTTSRDAAMAMTKEKVVSHRHRIFYALLLSYNGLTDEEISERTGIPGNTVRPRRGELLRQDLIYASTVPRYTRSGHLAKVWLAYPTAEDRV